MVFKKIFKFLKKKKVTKKLKRKRAVKRKIKKRITKKSKIRSIIKKEKLIAEATHYFNKIQVAILKMKDTLKINDKIHIKGHTTDFTQNVTSMQINHKPIMMAKKGQEIGLLAKNKVRHKDKVYKA